MDQMIHLTIDDAEVIVPKGITVLQACQSAHIEVPVFCYHPKLAIAGNCRMCLVEIDKSPKPVASCAMPVSEGMVIKTKTPMVEKARNGALEFLLINHPLDCPICDQGGECDLQDITINYSRGNSRFALNKRAVTEKHMGPLIKTAMTRCIHCTRCVRFSNDIAGIPEIGTSHRGEYTEITTLENAITSELSGNLIDICPVGALTNKPNAFHDRSWELKKTDGIDVMDAVGSNIRIDSRGNKVFRILPRENNDINEVWISDRTRFACDGLSAQRLDQPYKRENGKLVPCTWDDAFSLIHNKLKLLQPSEIAALIGNQVDIESVYALRLLLDAMNVTSRDCRQDSAQLPLTNPMHYRFNTTIQGIEKADAILLIGTNPRTEAAIINARIRKRTLAGNVMIGLIGDAVDLTYPYEHIGLRLADLQVLLDDKHSFVQKFKTAKNPVIIIGQSCFTRSDVDAFLSTMHAIINLYPAIIQADWNGYNVLHTSAARVGSLMIGFSPLVTTIDDTDAAMRDDIAIQDPGTCGLATREILKNCQSGNIKALYLHGVDEIDSKQFGSDTFVIYQGHHGDQSAHRADVILPGAAYTEKTALYANTEGRIQESQAAIQPPKDAKEDWKIIRALSARLGHTLPFNTRNQLLEHLFKEYPQLSDIGQIPAAEWTDLIENTSAHEATAKIEKIPQLKAAAAFIDAPFAYAIHNTYMTCAISRHSKTMADCVNEIINKRNPNDTAA